MSNKLENPPAFPVVENGQKFGNYHGMTLRDYFAAKAMQGLCANPNAKQDLIIAKAAFEIADTMLKERQS